MTLGARVIPAGRRDVVDEIERKIAVGAYVDGVSHGDEEQGVAFQQAPARRFFTRSEHGVL
jgi:hypothetical protein